MIKQIKEWAGMIALIAIIATWIVPSPAGMLGGTTNFDLLDTTDGYAVDGTTVIDGSGNLDAPVTSSTGSFTGDVGIGTTSPSELLHVEDASATSTAAISSGAASVGGRLILEDHDGAGCTETVALNGTLTSKSVTCPAGI